MSTITLDLYVILLYFLQLVVMLYPDIGGYLVKISRFCVIPYSFPISLARTLNWFGTVFPRTFDPCVFFHTVTVCSIVDFYRRKVNFIVNSFIHCSSTGCLEVLEYLKMNCSFFTPFNLAYCVNGLHLLMEPVNILLTISFKVVHCQKVASCCHSN